MKIGDLVRNKYSIDKGRREIGIVVKTPTEAYPPMPADDGNLWTRVYWLRGNWAGTTAPLPTYHLEVISDD